MRNFSCSATFAFLLSCSLLAACGGRYEPEPGSHDDSAHEQGNGNGNGQSDKVDPDLEAFGIAKKAPVGLVGRAVLPAATFVDGPASGLYAGANFSAQAVQGFSCLVDVKDGSFWALSDNGYGSIENSSDFRLRIYRIRPDLKTASGG